MGHKISRHGIILNRAAVDELLIKSLRKRCSFSQRIIICIQIDSFLFFFSLLMMARHFTAGTPPAKIGNNNMGNAEFMTKVWPKVACVVVVQVLPILRSSSGRVSVDVVVVELQHSIWMDNGGNFYPPSFQNWFNLGMPSMLCGIFFFLFLLLIDVVFVIIIIMCCSLM